MRTIFFFLFSFSIYASAQQRFQFTQPKMGSPFTIIFYATDSVTAKKVADGAFALVDSFNTIFSDYLATSELNRLSQTAGSGRSAPVSSSLLHILQMSQKAALQSRYAFDVTIGPLSQLWRKARREKKFPFKEEAFAAKRKVGMQYLKIDTVTKTVTLLQPGMQLDLGGIAKGYVAQQVIVYLLTNGITSALADAGGDLVGSNPPPGKSGWKVGINLPESTDQLLAQTIEISNSAVATSGDLYQYIEHKGKRYSHIIDPRTGYGVQHQRNVTVIAANGATADWLATACSILPLRQCKKLVKRFSADLLISHLENGKVKYFVNKGMKKRLAM